MNLIQKVKGDQANFGKGRRIVTWAEEYHSIKF